MIFKNFLPRGLFGRTLLIIMLPAILLQIAVSTVFFERHWSRVTDRMAASVVSEIALVTEEISTNIDILESPALKSLDLQFSIDVNTHSLPDIKSSNTSTITDDLTSQLRRQIKYKFNKRYFPEEKIINLYILTEKGLLKVTIPEGRLYNSSSEIFIMWMVGISIILFTIALIFMRNQIRPIYRLGLIAERLGRGIPVGNIKPTGAHEIRLTTEAFITMQNRINQFIDQRTTMLAGVSHDLRTPLTRMKLQLEMMDNEKEAESLRDDITDMENMIEGYLSFAKGDDGEPMQKIDFNEFIKKIIDGAKRLSLDVTDKTNHTNIILWAKPMTLTRAFDNIISNAARYASHLTIESHNDKNNITLTITDNGEGIPEHKIVDVLKPFVRGEDSRNNKTGGVGLGLTIANDIITAHGGSLSLANCTNGHGLIVIITLPL